MVAQKSKAISILLKDIYRKSSETPEQWENTSSKFEELWKFLICSEQLMPSLSELKVQEILGPFIAIVKDFSVLLYWQFAMLTTVLAGLMYVNMVVTTTVGFWLIPVWVSVSKVEHSTYQGLNLCMDVP